MRAYRWIAAALLIAGAARSAPPVPPPADPLTASIHSEDVERFARVFDATRGAPSADQLQRGYLDGASYGVAVFTPDRIVSAAHLAQAVAHDPAQYRRALTQCLPRVKAATTDLHAIYLALHGLLPEAALPQIYVVIGAGNSGGTAGPNAQVLGLEVLCAQDPSADGLRTTLRRFFAHETVHTFQHEPKDEAASPLLAKALTEGAADFIAALVTGQTPEPARAAWAAPREAELWAQFRKDMAATRPAAARADPAAARAATHRWLENYQAAPPGWPFEAGYWVGMRIWQSYYDRAPDKHRAIREMLDWDDADAMLARSGYAGGA
jgi:hypothetical protein